MCKDQPTEKKRFKWRRSPRPPIPPADRRLSEDSQAPQALCPHCGELFFVYDAPLHQDAVAIPPADRRLSEDSQAPLALCPHCGELFFVYDAPLH